MKNFILISMIMLAFAGCKKDKEEDPTPAVVPESFYISGTLDGDDFKWINGQNIFHSQLTANDGGAGTYWSNFSQAGTSKSFTIKLQSSFFSGSKADEATFKNFFNPGSRPFTTPGVYEGVEINFYDGAAPWTTWSMSSAQPSSAHFTISSRTLRKSVGRNFVDVKGSFSCNIHDNNGDPRPLTNGKFYCTFVDE